MKTYNFKRFDNGRLAYEEAEVGSMSMITCIKSFIREGYRVLVKDEKRGIAILYSEEKNKLMQWTRIEKES